LRPFTRTLPCLCGSQDSWMFDSPEEDIVVHNFS
jgi:hypothetical protein